jgi:hypothetical protein
MATNLSFSVNYLFYSRMAAKMRAQKPSQMGVGGGVKRYQSWFVGAGA